MKGDASAEEKRLIDDWYAALGNSPLDDGEIPDEDALIAHFDPIIQEHIRAGKQTKAKRITPWYAVAAAISVAILSVYFTINSRVTDNEQQQQLTEAAVIWKQVYNDSRDTKKIALPDGSVVILEPSSHLKFPEQFQESVRRVFLDGQAFFQISQDVRRPFFVHTGEITTRVLGTSFTITSNDDRIVVAVLTGKVSVFAHPDTVDSSPERSIVLTPNQQAVYSRVDEKLLKGIVDAPQPLISRDDFKRIKFKETSASKIFETLEKVYGIDLVFDKHKFSSCLLNTTISDDELYKKLDVICQAIGGSYELKEDKIVITGKGCE